MLGIYKWEKNYTWLSTKYLGEGRYSSVCAVSSEGSNLVSRRPFTVWVVIHKDVCSFLEGRSKDCAEQHRQYRFNITFCSLKFSLQLIKAMPSVNVIRQWKLKNPVTTIAEYDIYGPKKLQFWDFVGKVLEHNL